MVSCVVRYFSSRFGSFRVDIASPSGGSHAPVPSTVIIYWIEVLYKNTFNVNFLYIYFFKILWRHTNGHKIINTVLYE